MVGRDKPVLSEVEGLIAAYNVFLLIEKWNYSVALAKEQSECAGISGSDCGGVIWMYEDDEFGGWSG